MIKKKSKSIFFSLFFFTNYILLFHWRSVHAHFYQRLYMRIRVNSNRILDTIPKLSNLVRDSSRRQRTCSVARRWWEDGDEKRLRAIPPTPDAARVWLLRQHKRRWRSVRTVLVRVCVCVNGCICARVYVCTRLRNGVLDWRRTCATRLRADRAIIGPPFWKVGRERRAKMPAFFFTHLRGALALLSFHSPTTTTNENEARFEFLWIERTTVLGIRNWKLHCSQKVEYLGIVYLGS